MGKAIRPGGDLVAAVRELAGADTLAFGGVGFVGQILPSTEAYHALHAARPGRAAAPRDSAV